jgi:DNA-binding NtrC family response regulator
MPGRRLLVAEPWAPDSHLKAALAAEGWNVLWTSSVDQACDLARHEQISAGLALLADIAPTTCRDLERLTGGTSLEWVAVVAPHILKQPAAAKSILDNFSDYHTFPLELNRLLFTLGHAHGRANLRRTLDPVSEWIGRYGMIGKSAPMLDLYAKLDRLTSVDAPVLILGESGVGKELVARAIHLGSRRSSAPFVPVNCAGLPQSLIHSELFGYERGAFTGAHQRKIGSLEAAHGGVLFLDEIGDLPLELQAHLLRFLEEKTIVRLGSNRSIPVDVRVIAATHVDLEDAVKRGRIREDLFYRLNVLHLDVPPLRDRPGDVELLAAALFRKFADQKKPFVRGFSEEALRLMRGYSWPGNVRELLNRVQHAMILCETRLVWPRDLGLQSSHPRDSVPLSSARAAFERTVIQSTLHHHDQNVSKAARALGISRVTLYRLMDKFDIHRSQQY